MIHLSRALVVSTCAATLAATGASVALAVASVSAPAKDSFVATVTAATGRFAGDHGGMTLVFAPGPGQASRHLSVTLRGRSCGRTRRCVGLIGSLTGTLTSGPIGVPDTGSSLAIRAAGTIKPLGRVLAAGTVHGTGFIAHGRETVRLKLTAAGGTVTIGGDSGLVPGGTSP